MYNTKLPISHFFIKWGACTARHEGCYQFLSTKQSNWFSFGQGEWMDSSSDKEVIELEWPTKKLKLGICIHRIAEVHSCWALYSLKNCGLLENCICSPSLFLADCVVETTKLRVEKLLILTHPWSVHWQHILVEVKITWGMVSLSKYSLLHVLLALITSKGLSMQSLWHGAFMYNRECLSYLVQN